MKTPKEYTNYLKNKVITTDMLVDCLFSVNKRAKNCRDKEREYREKYRHDRYGTEEKYREKKEEYYSQKEKLLNLFKPDCIHKEVQQRRTRFYDYEDEYEMDYEASDVLYSGCYYDKEMHEVVQFDDIMCPYSKFYLFYDFGNRSFHIPIDDCILDQYPNLEITDIGSLKTYGKKVDVLLSMQFVKKVLALIDSKDFTYIESNNKQIAS